MTWTIPLSTPWFGAEEANAAQRVLASNWLSMGEETQAFEEEFAHHLGVRHALACSSGTAALHLGLLALGIGPDSQVIQPAVNFVAAANMTLACGAQPLFADIIALDEPTIAPDGIAAWLDRIAASGTGGPHALILMHYGGYACRLDEILPLCRARGVAVIEDACHAPGARYHSNTGITRSLGTLGDIGCFSFFSNKNLATGEGGMVVTDRDDLADILRRLRSHGMTTLTWDRHHGHAATYDVTAPGYNYRIDELRSAIGREQLRKLEAGNQHRRTLVRAYRPGARATGAARLGHPLQVQRAGPGPGAERLPPHDPGRPRPRDPLAGRGGLARGRHSDQSALPRDTRFQRLYVPGARRHPAAGARVLCPDPDVAPLPRP